MELNSAGHICMMLSALQFPWSQMEVLWFLSAKLGTASTSVLLGVPAQPVLQLQLPYGCSLTKTTHFFHILAFHPQYLIHSTSWVRLHSLCLFLGVCFSVYLYVLSQWRPRAGTESNAAFSMRGFTLILTDFGSISCCQVYETGSFTNLQNTINWQFHLASAKELRNFPDMLGYTDKCNT